MPFEDKNNYDGIQKKEAGQRASLHCFDRIGTIQWRRSKHAHATYPGLFFSTARVQPQYMGREKKESPRTGLCPKALEKTPNIPEMRQF